MTSPHLSRMFWFPFWLFGIDEGRDAVSDFSQIFRIYLWSQAELDGYDKNSTLSTSLHYDDVTMGTMGYQNTSNSTVYLTICFGQHQRNIKTPRYWPFVRWIHRWPAPKGQWRGKKLPFDDVLMQNGRRDATKSRGILSSLLNTEHIHQSFIG